MKDSPEQRRKELQAIHVRARQLGLSDEKFRELKKKATGLESCGQMSSQQLGLVLDALRARGAVSHRTKERDGKRPNEGQERLVEALWRQLADLAALKNPSPQALRHFVSNLTGADSVRWLDSRDLNKVIESLKGWLKRVREAERGGGGGGGGDAPFVGQSNGVQ
jgi:phage gp16-like protein